VDGGDGKDRGNTVTEPANQPAKRSRSLTVFYVVLGVVIALVLFGGWFWRTWTVWWFDADEAKRRQTEAAAKLGMPVEKTVDLGDGVKLELVLIPPGRFRMGDQAGAEDAPHYGHQWVRITKPFYMGKYEVTQEQWERVMGANPSSFKVAKLAAWERVLGVSPSEVPKRPVEDVSWNDCQEFLEKLNGLGKGPGQFRLPTEAEWEWACRAGTRTRFHFGNDEDSIDDYGWYAGNSDGETHVVGQKKPNAWGLHDMHGNVWEWCGTWSEAYRNNLMPKTDPTGPMTGDFRVFRGGCYHDSVERCRSKLPQGDDPAYVCGEIGFRLVLAPALP
jgi:formylglycine-generating enzyme required for sulfatase activity